MNKRVPQKAIDTVAEELEQNNFSHPRIEAICRDLGIHVHQLRPTDNDPETQAHHVQQQHTEARRKALVSLVAKRLLERSPRKTSSMPHCASLSAWSTHRVSVKMKRLQHSLQVRNNLKTLQASQEERRRSIQLRLDSRQQRASLEKQQLTEQLRSRGEDRDRKLQSLLDLKYKREASHELRALKQSWNSLPMRTATSYTPIKAHRPCITEPPDDDSKLQELEEKITRSIFLRQQQLRQRSSCGFRQDNAIAKAQANKAALEQVSEAQRTSQVFKIQAKAEASRKRRIQLLAQTAARIQQTAHKSKSVSETAFVKARERAAARKIKQIEDARKRKLLHDEQQTRSLGQQWRRRQLSVTRELQRHNIEEQARKHKLLDKQRITEEKVKRLRDAEDFVANSAVFLTMQDGVN